MAEDLGLGITISLRDRFSPAAGKAGNSMKHMRGQARDTVDSMKRMQGAMQAAAGAAIFMAGRRAFGALINASADLETGMAKIFTLMPDATEETRRSFTDLAKSAIAQGVDVQQATSTLFAAVSAGFSDIGTATDFFNTVIKGSIAGAAETEPVLKVLSKTLRAYGIEASGAANVMDKLNAAAQFGQTDLNEMAAALPFLTSTAKTAGISLDEMLATVSALTRVTKDSNQASTALVQMIANIQKPTSDAVKIAKKLGFEFNFTALKTKGLSQFLTELRNKTQGQEEVLVKLFGSTEALRVLFPLVGDSAKDFQEALDLVKNSAGLTQKQFDIQSNTFSQQMNRFKGSITLLKNSIGTPLIKALGPVVDKISEIGQKIGAWLEEHPKIAKVVAGSLGILAALGVALGAVAAIMGVIALVSIPALIVFAKIAIVVGLVIAAFIALKPVLQELWEKNQDVIQDIKAAWTEFANAVWPIIKAVAKIVIWYYQMVFRAMAAVFGGILRVVVPIFRAIIDNTKTTVQFMRDAWLVFKTDILPVFQPIIDAVKYLHETAVQGFSAMVEWVTNLIEKVKEFINQFPQIKKIFEFVREGWDIVTGKSIRDFISSKISEGKGALSARAEEIRQQNAGITVAETTPALSKTSNLEESRNLQLSASRNPNVQVQSPIVNNNINVQPAKIQPADVILDKQKVGKVIFEYQQLQTVRAN